MIKSMTGFGRCEVTEEQWKMTVEIKAVNHRYLDVSVKMPKKLSIFESSIRTVLKEYMERGKVDVFVSYEDLYYVLNQSILFQLVKLIPFFEVYLLFGKGLIS